jgi:hypothetical protein
MRRIALLAFAVAALAVAGFGIGAGSADAAPGVSAHAGGPYSGFVGNAIQFDGSASGGAGLSFFWTFGDGTTAIGARPVKVYSAPGTYSVTLTVQDFTGSQAVTATTATVFRSSAFVPSGCFTSVSGGVFCGQTVSNLFPGCVWTALGYICSQTFATPGVIVTNPVFPVTTLATCANPNYALTPFCQNLR